eukprot:TRINITY_DN2651_c0_g1_i5.p1 TRINITY_DN2651_c0_g1~~TRINITY_DN2651_c0_g1_i5.p1  ORF type:complete len:261 (+),score=36.45 TRINITY_DN2651_c0_g1_i5:220-1002(+)
MFFSSTSRRTKSILANKENDNQNGKFDEKDSLAPLLKSNLKWSSKKVEQDPNFFKRLEDGQEPRYLWLGCADSRVVADQLLGLNPGDVFVHRNVGNIVMHSDMNCMSVLEYAVGALKVKHIIVCGHYNCGAVKASLTLPQSSPGLVNFWINEIRSSRNEHVQELSNCEEKEKLPKMCEFNVIRQTYNVITSPIVQAAWAKGQELTVHGFIYQLKDGLLKRLCGPVSSNDFEYVVGNDTSGDYDFNKKLVGKVDQHLSFEN